MTPLGMLFVALTAFGLWHRPAFPWVLALSATFPYSAAITIAGNSVIPFHLCAAAAAGLLIFEPRRGRHAGTARPGVGALALFVTWSLFITLAGPILFAGEHVLNPRTGIDAAVVEQEPLGYTVSTLAQAGYLVLTVCAAVYLARQESAPLLAGIPFALGTVIGSANLLFVRLGLPWPSDLFDTSTNVIYAIDRVRGGIFNEPSEFGGFSVAALMIFAVAAFRAEGRLRILSAILALLAALNLVNSDAGTALAGLSIIAGFGALVFFWRFARTGHGFLLIVFGAGSLTIALLLFGSTIFDWAFEILTGKVGSQSLDARSTSDAYSLGLSARTWGLGVGLGANRPSSFATMLLSCVGVIGTLAFTVFLARVVPRAARTPLGSAAAWGLLGFLAAKVVSLPDLATPGMWLLIAACAHVAWTPRGQSASHFDTLATPPEMGSSDGPQRNPENAETPLAGDRRARVARRADRARRHPSLQTDVRVHRPALRHHTRQRHRR